jgi:hypothetical protein
MRREQTNQIRFIMEELLPPTVRDTALFKFAATLAWGKHISTLAEFRKAWPALAMRWRPVQRSAFIARLP